MDFWLNNTPDNARRVLKAIKDFGLGSLDVTESDLTEENRVIQLGFPPRRIDLLTGIDGVQFAECYARRVTLTLAGLELHFIEQRDFVLNKRAVGRPQDLADALTIETGYRLI